MSCIFLSITYYLIILLHCMVFRDVTTYSKLSRVHTQRSRTWSHFYGSIWRYISMKITITTARSLFDPNVLESRHICFPAVPTLPLVSKEAHWLYADYVDNVSQPLIIDSRTYLLSGDLVTMWHRPMMKTTQNILQSVPQK